MTNFDNLWNSDLYPPISADFYLQHTVEVAKQLLDCILIYRSDEGIVAGRISETEAYLSNDAACHASRGKTRRNATMFGPPGRAYIYFTYGIHYCLNAVTAPEGVGEAVLIRSVEPICGMELMAFRRSLSGWQIYDPSIPNIDTDLKGIETDLKARIRFSRLLCGGPGRLCKSFGLTCDQDGIDLTNSNSLWISKPANAPLREILASKRIGISKGTEALWRFTIQGDQYTSR